MYSVTNNSVIEPLHISCNRVLRALQSVDRYYSVKKLYANYNALPVHLLGNLYIGKLVYKSFDRQRNPMANSTRDLFQLNHASHGYSTRLSSSNYLHKKSDRAFLSSYVNIGCTVWNNIPDSIRKSSSIGTFVDAFKKYLFDNW